MIGSYILYIGLAAFCWLFSYWANRYQKKSLVWLIILTLTLISGLRHPSVGADTANYLRMFDLIDRKLFHLAYGLEESFKYIIYFLLRILRNPRLVLILIAFVTNFCIITRFWELRKISSFTCMVVCYYMTCFFMTMSGLRQFCAVALVFFFTRYLSQKRIFLFILGVLFAMLIHQSAVAGLILLAINCLRWKELSRPQKLFYIFAVLAVPVFLVIGVRVFERYARYFSEIKMDIGMMVLLKMAFLLASMLYVFGLHRDMGYFSYRSSLDQQERFDITISGAGYTMALLLGMLGYVFLYVDRIGWYFTPYEGVYFGMLLKGKKPLDRVLFFYFIIFVVGYAFVYSMTNNSQYNMPYAFFW